MDIYTEKKIFDEIILSYKEYPNWNEILKKHGSIFLNLTDESLIDELAPNTPLFEFVKATGGKIPIALNEYFDSIYEDVSIISLKPRAAFFLNYSPTEATEIQNNFGIIVQSVESIDDKILTGSFKRKLLKDEQITDSVNFGWKSLLTFNFPPSNSLVLSDNYLLPSTEKIGNNYVASGQKNVLDMLNCILPDSLLIPYHITIISGDNNQDEKWRNKVANQLKKEISKLRSFQIMVEVVFIKTHLLHERILLLNYVNSSCEHGFNVFKAKDLKTVHVVNKLQINSYFSSLSNNQGESEYQIANKDLIQLKKVCDELTSHIQKETTIYKGAILGDCSPDKSIRNRLINDVLILKKTQPSSQ